jgi:hypothetical protein
MTDENDEHAPKKSATQALADLVARRKASGGGGGSVHDSRRQAERAASARSLSRSKPALRK